MGGGACALHPEAVSVAEEGAYLAEEAAGGGYGLRVRLREGRLEDTEGEWPASPWGPPRGTERGLTSTAAAGAAWASVGWAAGSRGAGAEGVGLFRASSCFFSQ